MITTIATTCTAVIGTLTIACFIFYRKSEIDDKIAIVQKLISDNQLTNQKNSTNIKDEIYEKLTENKNSLESGMKEFIKIISEIRETDKNLSIQFINLVNSVKDELKNDYTSRYNDLLLLINTKANESDFNRLEQKFDKVNETMTELKTIIQMKLKKEDRGDL